jgi:arylsulfatase A-like enzyme
LINNRFAHVTDVGPTLLEMAGVKVDGAAFHGRLVEPMVGTSLLPVLTGARAAAHDPASALGYELSGNAALFMGDVKLVRNLPPTGDGSWQLFDIVRDPGETHDLSHSEPQKFAEMQADYAAYANRDQVLPMPPGYTAEAQINANALRENFLPQTKRLLPELLAILGVIAALFWFVRRRLA